ncbi:MAG: hypothetical protein QOF21_942 [Actinomycetota bacterium]|jgi:RimJ/RimL family protein N-acetyltransferase
MTAIPVDVSKWATLRNGRRVIIRPIEASDAAALLLFHEGLSDDTKRLRFFTPHPELTEAEVARFTQVDHLDREALVALSLATIVAVGRYDRTGHDEADVAFVVADAWQGVGLATELIDRLGRRAVAHDITRFVADTLGENHKMLHVFSNWSPAKKLSFDNGVVHVEMPIVDAARRGLN